jgi:glycosyl transferase family 25
MAQHQLLRFPIPAFYINLDRDPDRRELLERELEKTAIAAERVSAADGRNVPDWLTSFYDDRMGAGEVGCSASHLTICRIILERDLPFALVLEDDARIQNDCLNVIENALVKAPRGWDIIRLIESSSRPVQELAHVGGGRTLVRYVRIPRSTTGLIISKTGAQKLLTPRLIKEPIDVEVRWPWQLDLDVYGIEPPPITQASGVDLETRIAVRSRPKKNNQFTRMLFNIRKMGLGTYLICCMRLARGLTPPVENSIPHPEAFVRV